jgi:RimJ/RimL family protein N-acetyltransferase
LTADVQLRDVTEADLPILFEHQADPVSNEMAAFPARDKDAFTVHWMTNVLKDETVVAKAVLFEDKVVGNVGSFERDGVREVGYWIGREFWGKGIATEALSQFLSYDDERPLVARVAKHNVASVRVLEKCGFVVSGEAMGVSWAGDDEIEEVILTLDQ